MDQPISPAGRAAMSGARYRFADLLVEADTGRVLRDDREIELPRLSYELLLALIEASPATLSVDLLMDRVWPGLVVSPETVSQRVKLLRDALGDDAQHPRYVAGLRGRGYRLAVPVTPCQDRRQPEAGAGMADSAWDRSSAEERLTATLAEQADSELERTPGQGSVPSQPTPVAAAGRSGFWLRAVSALVAIVSMLWLVGEAVRDRAQPGGGLAAVPTPGSLAVLPFATHAVGAGSPEFFADGLHDELLTRLAHIPGLRVISRSSVLAYRDSRKNLRRIAAELDVDSVLEGSVQQVGEQIRVNVQLIDARNDQHLWAQIFDRQLSVANLLAIQSEIAAAISSALQLAVTPAAAAPTALGETDNVAAYSEFMAGQEALLGSPDPDRVVATLAVAEDHLRRAVALDPGFARAQAGVAQAVLQRDWASAGKLSVERRESARASAERAMQLAPDLPEAHLALAMYQYYGFRDYAQALGHVAKAEQRLPGSAQVQVIKTWILLRQGRAEAARESSARALELDPRNPVTLGARWRTLLTLRDYDAFLAVAERRHALAADPAGAAHSRAIAALARTGELAPMLDVYRTYPGQGERESRWRIFFLARDWKAALAELAAWSTLSEADPERGTHELLSGLTLGQAGRPEAARIALARAAELLQDRVADEPTDAIAWGRLGMARAGLGQLSQARAAAARGSEILPLERDAVAGLDVLELSAMVEAMSGDGAAAAASLGRLLAEPGMTHIHLYRLDPLFDRVREHPDFVALIEKYAQPERPSTKR